MFTIGHVQNLKSELNYIELIKSKKASAKIFLSLGASLQSLTLDNKTIINDLYPLTYNNTYASSILFPFAGRIKDGKYNFQGKSFQLENNQKDEKMALHGLIYNKEFIILDRQTSKEFVAVTLCYIERDKTKGFPYKYSIYLTYTLTENKLDLKVKIVNNDVNSFPFSVGWHPYFYSSDLSESYLSFKSDKKIAFNKDMIPEKVNDIIFNSALQIKDAKLDDCYILNHNNIFFNTPDYNLSMSSTSSENYLQIYTPDKKNIIAIEPLTGPSNNFNNKLGLQILNSKEIYNIVWSIKVTGK